MGQDPRTCPWSRTGGKVLRSRIRHSFVCPGTKMRVFPIIKIIYKILGQASEMCTLLHIRQCPWSHFRIGKDRANQSKFRFLKGPGMCDWTNFNARRAPDMPMPGPGSPGLLWRAYMAARQWCRPIAIQFNNLSKTVSLTCSWVLLFASYNLMFVIVI